jgi:hypothetical protein
MPFYGESFEGDTRGFEEAERMAYLWLLWEQWRLGSLPVDVRSLKNLARVQSLPRFKAMWERVIKAKFMTASAAIGPVTDLLNAEEVAATYTPDALGDLVQVRCAFERVKAGVIHAQRVKAGVRSGDSRKGKSGGEGTTVGTSVAQKATKSGTPVERAFTENGVSGERSLDTGLQVTGSYEPKASLARDAGEHAGEAASKPGLKFNGGDLEAVWVEVNRKAVNGAPALVDAAALIRQQAGITGADPDALARSLLVANVEMLADWRKRGEHHGSPKITDFANADHFAKVVDWLDGKRAGARASGGGRSTAEPARPRPSDAPLEILVRTPPPPREVLEGGDPEPA